MLERNRNNMPDGFEPPVPAWAADWSGGVTRLTSAFFGIQGSATSTWAQWTGGALYAGENKPEIVEKATFVDKAGIANTVCIAYWRNDGYDAWWARDDVRGWWQNEKRVDEGSGYWREVFHVTPDRIETLHSSPNTHGIAELAGELEGPVDEHAYPGAARDRIPASGAESLSGKEAVQNDLAADVSDDGKRIVIKPPQNMCIIRSGQDWGYCDTEERNFYLTEVEPSLRAGMDYLRDNAVESRCLCMRLMRQVETDGRELEQTFGLGYGLDIYAFEEWAKSHPTHLKIFGQFMNHAEKFGADMQLRLWHEVSVIAGEDAEFEYVACHPETGLLSYAAI